jgi:pilus assembly protein CpaB
MKRARNLVSGSALLTLSLIIGAFTALAAFGWANSQRGGDEAVDGPSVPVLVARNDIPAGTKLAENLVEVRQVSDKSALVGVIDTVAAADGRVLRYPLSGGEQVTESKLVAKTVVEGEGLAFSVPEGFRAMAVPVDEVSGAGGLIVPGDRVDIMVSTTLERTLGPGTPVTPQLDADLGKPIVLTVLQDMLVLAVGQMVTEPLDPGRDPATLRPGNAEAQPAANSVTFAVRPAQAQALFMAANQGKLGLALRAYGDSSENSLEPSVRLEAAGSGTIRQASR